MMLADILTGRSAIDEELQRIIDERTTPWGVTVQSVEIRDIVIPPDLENAMSRQAQAERERQARVILGESEEQIAASFSEASKAYVNNPTALHLRAMNMLFEGLKEKGALVIVPSSAVDTMNLGAVSGLVSIAQNNIPRDEK
jgi:regulator of protease activity HflC (stomatin/prohibitin superfamily)